MSHWGNDMYYIVNLESLLWGIIVHMERQSDLDFIWRNLGPY